MTIAELLEQAKALTPQERKELAKMLIDMIDTPSVTSKTGNQIVAMLRDMEPVQFVDDHIQDPAEWVQAQRRKRQDRLQSFGSEED